MLTALCREAVVNLNALKERWYVQCYNALLVLENVGKWLLLEMTEKRDVDRSELVTGIVGSHDLCSCLKGLDIKMSAFICIMQ